MRKTGDKQIKPGGKGLASTALLERLKAGDQEAFCEWVNAETPRLYYTGLRLLGNKEAAKDCVQEAFEKAFVALDKFEGRSTLRTWLYKIFLNQCFMRLRKRKRRLEVPLDKLLPVFDADDCRIEPIWDLPESVEEIVIKKENRQRIREAIEKLPENARNVLILRDIEELSTKEAAEILQISEGAVKVRLHRARAALKKLLEPLYSGHNTNAGRG